MDLIDSGTGELMSIACHMRCVSFLNDTLFFVLI